MGYYTKFKLAVSPQWVETKRPLKELVTEVEYLSPKEAESMKTVTFDVFNQVKREVLTSYPKDTLEDVLEGECKWYDWKQDMKAISIKYPEVLFTLTGEGEEPGDMWIAYFKHGKMQVCPAQITYPEFNEEELR